VPNTERGITLVGREPGDGAKAERAARQTVDQGGVAELEHAL
jgi:hypothetical protein